MEINVYTHSYSDMVPTMKIKVYHNGIKISRIPIGCESVIQMPDDLKEGDVLEFKLQYFKARVIFSSQQSNYFVYWDVPANPVKKQIKLMFTNCLKVIEVDEETFAEPHKYFKVEKPSKVAPNAFINIVGLAVSICFIVASMLFTASSETWRDFAMIFGISGAFRFLSFVLSKEIYRSSGFQSALFFSIIGIIIVLAHGAMPYAFTILALAIFSAISIKAHVYYTKGSEVAF